MSKAVDEIPAEIKQNPGFKSIIFAAGDDILFKGRYSEIALRNLQQTYHRVTRDLTCSIGYGQTLQEVYVALKWAKTMPGKSSVVGVSKSHLSSLSCPTAATELSSRLPMIILNFAHPLTASQHGKIEALTGTAIHREIELMLQFDGREFFPAPGRHVDHHDTPFPHGMAK